MSASMGWFDRSVNSNDGSADWGLPPDSPGMLLLMKVESCMLAKN